MFQLERRTYVFAISVTIILFAWFAVSLSPAKAEPTFRRFLFAHWPPLVLTALLLGGIVADVLELRLAIVLNPLLHNAPIWSILFLAVVPQYTVDEPWGLSIVLAFLAPPSFLASLLTAYLYWRDARRGDF